MATQDEINKVLQYLTAKLWRCKVEDVTCYDTFPTYDVKDSYDHEPLFTAEDVLTYAKIMCQDIEAARKSAFEEGYAAGYEAGKEDGVLVE